MWCDAWTRTNTKQVRRCAHSSMLRMLYSVFLCLLVYLVSLLSLSTLVMKRLLSSYNFCVAIFVVIFCIRRCTLYRRGTQGTTRGRRGRRGKGKRTRGRWRSGERRGSSQRETTMWMTMDGGEKRSELEPWMWVWSSKIVACHDAPRDRRSAMCQRRHWCSHCCALCPAYCCTRRSNFPCCDVEIFTIFSWIFRWCLQKL